MTKLHPVEISILKTLYTKSGTLNLGIEDIHAELSGKYTYNRIENTLISLQNKYYVKEIKIFGGKSNWSITNKGKSQYLKEQRKDIKLHPDKDFVNELKQMTRQQLYDYCKANKIKGYSGKTKQQRIDLILEYHNKDVLKDKRKSMARFGQTGNPKESFKRQKALTQKQIKDVKLVSYTSDIKHDHNLLDFKVKGSAYLILEKRKIKVKFEGFGIYDYENKQHISLNVIVSNPNYIIDDYNQTGTFRKIFKEILKGIKIY